MATTLLQRSAAFQSGAPSGTGLEWLVIASVVVPAVILIFLVYVAAPWHS